jgi:transcriptional regulator of arginine metabolism
MKSQRHAALLALVRRHRIESQERLRELLHAEGFDVTQATLSRDIRELGLAKIPDAAGAHYTPPLAPDPVHPALGQLVAQLALTVDGVGPLLVVRTPAGSANALGIALDRAAWPGVVGTIAGDDTLLVVTRSPAARRRVAARLGALVSAS